MPHVQFIKYVQCTVLNNQQLAHTQVMVDRQLVNSVGTNWAIVDQPLTEI